MAQRTRKPAGDATGRKTDELRKEHAEELRRRQQELGMIHDVEEDEKKNGITDLTVRGGADGTGPRTVTQHPGQSGAGSLNADGTMTTFDGRATIKTNATALTGDTDFETPGNVPGEPPGVEREREIVDTVNATRVADPALGAKGLVRDEDFYDERLSAADRKPRTLESTGNPIVVESPTKVVRVNQTVEQMTVSAGEHYDFEEGRQYRVPKHVYDHLEERSMIWH